MGKICLKGATVPLITASKPSPSRKKKMWLLRNCAWLWLLCVYNPSLLGFMWMYIVECWYHYIHLFCSHTMKETGLYEYKAIIPNSSANSIFQTMQMKSRWINGISSLDELREFLIFTNLLVEKQIYRLYSSLSYNISSLLEIHTPLEICQSNRFLPT